MTTKKTTKKATAGKTPHKKAPKKRTATRPAEAGFSGSLKLPKVGQKLTRTYRGTEHVIEVVEGGFRHNETVHKSLTALAKEITGYEAISGPAFFGLWKREGAK